MKIQIIPSPSGEDVMLKITSKPTMLPSRQEIHKIVLARHELQELKVAIEKFQEARPMELLKGATGK